MEKRPRGRPSDQELSRASLAAALDEFLASGYQGLSMEAIAARAGVSKVSLYRRWANKAEVMADVFRLLSDTSVPLGPGPVAVQVAELLRATLLGDGARSRGEVVLRTIGEIAHSDELVALYRRHVLAPRMDQMRQLLEGARQRGELAPTASIEAASLLLGGPVLLAQLALMAGMGAAFPEGTVDALVAMVLRGLGLNTNEPR